MQINMVTYHELYMRTSPTHFYLEYNGQTTYMETHRHSHTEFKQLYPRLSVKNICPIEEANKISLIYL